MLDSTTKVAEAPSFRAFVLFAGVVGEAARGVPDAELTCRGRDLLGGFVLLRAPEREARFRMRRLSRRSLASHLLRR